MPLPDNCCLLKADRIWDIPLPILITFLRLLAAAQKESEPVAWLWQQPPAKLAEALEEILKNQIELRRNLDPSDVN